MKPVFYIAGPFRAPTRWGVEQNIRAAEAAALEVWRMGAVALCPHTMNRFYEGAADDAVWLAGGLELLRRCDAVLVLDGWQASSGTRAEMEEAIARGLPVYFDIATLRDALRLGVVVARPGREAA